MADVLKIIFQIVNKTPFWVWVGRFSDFNQARNCADSRKSSFFKKVVHNACYFHYLGPRYHC